MALVSEGENPAFHRRPAGLGPALQHRGELAGKRKLQGLPGLGLLDPQDASVQVDALPAERDHLAQAHAGIGSDQEDVALRGREPHGFHPCAPPWQHLGRGGDAPAALAVEPPATGDPDFHRVAQPSWSMLERR